MRKLTLLTLIVVLATTLSACSTVTSLFQKEITVIDDMGREISLPKVPARIVSIAPANTEFLFALGLEEKIVGVTDWCDYPAAALTKEKVGDFANPSVEKIVSLKPDLVVAASLHKDVVLQLDALKIPTIVLDALSLDQVLANADLLGLATGATKAADKLKQDIQGILKEVADKVGTLKAEDRPVVYYEVWYDPIMTAGPGTFIDELITKAGGTNLAGATYGKYPILSLEELIAKQPDVIFYGHAMETVEQLMGRDNWGTIPAIKNGRIYMLDENMILRPGPRIAEGLREMAKHLHSPLWP